MRTIHIVAAVAVVTIASSASFSAYSADRAIDRSSSTVAAFSATAGARVVYREVTIPAGTLVPIALDSYVASDSSRVEDTVNAHVRRPIVIDGLTAIPSGSTLVGHVTNVERAGRVKGRGRVAFRFERLSLAGTREQMHVRTSTVARQAAATKGEDAEKIGVPAAGGAVIGALAGGKKGAAIGAAAGGGAGTAVVLSTRGREVRLGRGAIATVRLVEPLTVRIRT